jgi:hypothetical protein
MTYLGSIGYFLTQGPVLSNGSSSEKLMLNGGLECTTCLSLALYAKCVCFASLTLTGE